MNLEQLVRVGTVTDVDNEKRLARALYPDTEISSDWLPVLINNAFIPAYDGPQKTEPTEGGSGEKAFEKHDHMLNIVPWMPKVGEQVLVLYEGIPNGRGYILGGVQTWR